MGARRNFHKGWQAQKKAPNMEKNVAKGPSHGEKCIKKALHKEKNVEKRAPTWRQSSKKVSHIANKNVFGFSGGGRGPTPAPPPLRVPKHVLHYMQSKVTRLTPVKFAGDSTKYSRITNTAELPPACFC